MSDKTFEISILVLTIVVVLGIVAGIILHASLVLVIAAAIVVEFGLGGLLLHVWGKAYMSRQ